MRWRMKGKNWEGRSFVVSAGLVVLLNEIEIWDPVRRPADGTVASKGHDQANPSSDHRPKPYSGPGTVRAADIGELNDPHGDFLAEQARATRDPRIKYWIHDGRMFSSYSTSSRNAWEWGEYNGPNKHLTHNHVSVLAIADTNTSSWDLGLLNGEGDDMLPLELGDKNEDVRLAKGRLNMAYGAGLSDSSDLYDAALKTAAAQYLGKYTGETAGKQGEKINARMWNGLLKDFSIKYSATPPGGVTEAQVKQWIADTQLVP